ncbi:MAG: c-type cytochrome [Deltaproteobacteria bacterium]|jgi:cytochrome c6
MKNVLTALVLLFAATSISAAGSLEGKGPIGELEFKEYCAGCHPNGGNRRNPKKPLGKKSLEGGDIKTVQGIVAKIRNPGPGMTRFDKEAISDKEATEIAEYILKTF